MYAYQINIELEERILSGFVFHFLVEESFGALLYGI